MLPRLSQRLKCSFIMCCFATHAWGYDVYSWVPDDSHCGGQFAKVTPLYPLTGDGIVLQASEQTVVKPSEGVIDMIGPVTLTQKNLYVISEQGVRINIEKEHQQVTLKGPVFMQYMNDQFAAESGVYHPKEQTIRLNHVQYRTNTARLEDQPVLWGRADALTYDHRVVLDHVTYSACPLDHPSWQLSAQKLTIDPDKTQLSVQRGRLQVKGVTVLSLPTIAIDLKPVRKSGFLMPKWTAKWSDSVGVDVPYYWNIAPNYDATVHGIWDDQRGVGGSLLVRYLQEWGHGDIAMGGMMDDEVFSAKQQQLLTQHSSSNALDLLRKATSQRRWLAYNMSAQWQQWTLESQYYWLEDPLILRDFEVFKGLKHDYNLPQNIALRYQSDHGDVGLALNHYQWIQSPDDTSHVRRYDQQPQLDASWSYDVTTDMSVATQMDASWFVHQTRDDVRRLYLQSSWHGVHHQGDASWLADVAIHWRDYTWQDTSKHEDDLLPDVSLTYQAPQMKVNDRILQTTVNWHFVPYHDQSSLPLLDTTAFNASGLSQINARVFDGLDRFSNHHDLLANIEWGDYDEHQYWWLTLGTGYRFDDQQVCLKDEKHCTELANKHWLPLAFEHEWHPSESWTFQDHWFIDWYDQTLYQSLFRLTHSYDEHNHTAVFVSQKKDVVHQITGLNVLSLFDHATIGVDQQYRLGDWDLSWQAEYVNEDNKSLGYDVSIEYNGCCWSSGLSLEQTPVALSDDLKAWQSPKFSLWAKLDGLGRWGL